MFFSTTTMTPKMAHINGTAVTVLPDETLLEAALRQGVAFPNSCRVGGCLTCKCKLTQGNVKQLTDSSYILSDDDIDQGVILACQSVPLSDVRIEVDLECHDQSYLVAGTVIQQEQLTHDITRLNVQLDASLDYRAGQYAQISIATLPNVVRSYSFASPAQQNNKVSFFVRKVAGGVFSSHINDQNLVGQRMQVQGPAGNFYVRESEAPLLLVAGGSGLAPILAILKQALNNSGNRAINRSVTLLFGARTAKDLYCLDEIEHIKQQWRGEFRFVTVLSEASVSEGWQGLRGLVTEQIPALLEAGTHAYLCGPPAMIDSAISTLRQSGVASEHIHADKFVTRIQDKPAGITSAASVVNSKDTLKPEAQAAGMIAYLKYFLFHLVSVCALLAILVGGMYQSIGLLTVVAFYVIGDAVLGDDISIPNYKHPRILTVQLWLAWPLLSLIVFAAVWTVSPGDPLGFGTWVTQLTGFDAIAARATTGFGHHISTVFFTGLMIGLAGTIPGHELTHRTWDPISLWVGRWLLAFSFDTSFSIEHVYGHHRYVATEHDPATAPRGRNVYHHVVASTIKGNVSAWSIEAQRLRRKGYGLFSLHNAVLRGYLMSVMLVLLAWGIGGWVGALFFTLCALFGKTLLEVVNYMEHYGIVRHPTTPVQPRHSWNTNRRISAWTMFNLTRHSHHHAQGELPYHELKPFLDAPMMINGYLTTLIIALIPPLWHKLMIPKVLAWDTHYATNEELELVARANRRSGMAVLMQSNPTAQSRG